VPGNSSAETLVQATSIGGMARHAIGLATAQPDANSVRGKVHSAFDKAWNLRLLPGSLISVVQHDVGCGPLFVVLTPEDSPILGACRPQRGVPMRVTAHALMVQTDASHSLRIDLSSASTWSTPKRVANVVSPADVAKNLQHTAAWIAARGKSGGLCAFDQGEDDVFGVTPVSCAGERALSALEGSWRALDAGEANAAAQHLLALVGLGPGLTPSGDDMLIGLLGALSLAEASYRCEWPWLGKLQQGLAQDCQPGSTTELSQQWLDAAIVREVPQRLSDVLCALLAAQPGEHEGDSRPLEAALARLTELGATSGVDALAGGWLALSALLPAPGAPTVRPCRS